MSGGGDMKKQSGVIYQGISFPFRFNSLGKVEKSKLTYDDFSRIKESIHQIIFTFQMERIMNTGFGVPRMSIFQSLDDITDQAILKHEIRKAIERHEDRVEVKDIRVYTDEQNEGTLIVELDLHIIKFLKDVTIRVPLDTSVLSFGGEF